MFDEFPGLRGLFHQGIPGDGLTERYTRVGWALARRCHLQHALVCMYPDSDQAYKDETRQQSPVFPSTSALLPCISKIPRLPNFQSPVPRCDTEPMEQSWYTVASCNLEHIQEQRRQVGMCRKSVRARCGLLSEGHSMSGTGAPVPFLLSPNVAHSGFLSELPNDDDDPATHALRLVSTPTQSSVV